MSTRAAGSQSVRRRGAGGAAATLTLFPSKQALRPPQQDQNREHVNEDGAALGQIELQHEVEHAKKQRGVIDADHAAEPADRHRDQKIDQIFERILWIEAEKLGAKTAAESRHAAAESECDGEQPVDIDAERFRHAAVIDGGADLRADPRALESEPDAERNQNPTHDQKDAVGAILQEAEIELAASAGGSCSVWLSGPITMVVAGNEDEDQPDRKQHLVEFAARGRAGDRAGAPARR